MLTPIKKNGSCVSGKFKRMNYFHGMLLTEEDFIDEQTYVREKLKTHNRLHGQGVVWGLDLKKRKVKKTISNETEDIIMIFIDRGLAIDCEGNEIVLCENYQVPVDEKIKEMKTFGKIKSKAISALYVGIRYCECESAPVEQLTSVAGDDPLHPNFSRVNEGFSIVILDEGEYHQCINSKCKTCHSTRSYCNCSEVPSCNEKDLIIFLGRIENYAINGSFNQKDANIYPFCSASYGSDLLKASPDWHRYKVEMLESVFKNKEKWVDLSFLIGKSLECFEDTLEKHHLKPGTSYSEVSTDESLMELLEKAATALPWARCGNSDFRAAEIDYVTDKHGECILFILVNNFFIEEQGE